MSLFLGSHNNKVDRKGRVSVPAPFRKHLANEPNNGIVVIPSFADPDETDAPPYLEAMGYSQLHAMQEGIAATYGIYSPEYESFSQLTFGLASELAFDTEGRIVLPSGLLEHTGITDAAVFWGLGAKFLILTPENHQKKLAATLRRTGGRKPDVMVRPAGSSQPPLPGGVPLPGGMR
jgi:MraZ protein